MAANLSFNKGVHTRYLGRDDIECITVFSLPVSYRSYPSDPAAHLTAGVEITVGVTTSVKDEGIKRLLPKEARDNIVQVRYQSTGCKDTHTHTSSGYNF